MAERIYPGFHRSAFDRFIPFRPDLDVEKSNARLMSRSPDRTEKELGQIKSPVGRHYTRLFSESMNGGDGKILPICRTPVTSRALISFVLICYVFNN
jgi:hypothetical protein